MVGYFNGTAKPDDCVSGPESDSSSSVHYVKRFSCMKFVKWYGRADETVGNGCEQKKVLIQDFVASTFELRL